MRRWAVVALLAIAGCEPPAADEAAPRAWVVPPPPAAWPLGVAHAAIGRSQAPQLVVGEGLSGSVTGSLQLPTLWQVPGSGPARAVAYGTLDGAQSIELIEIDSGRIVWRDATVCAGPIVGVTAASAVCADGKGTRAIGLDGKKKWARDGAGFVAMTDDRVVLTLDGEVLILDGGDGDELARIRLPAGVASDSIVASCGDAGRELFAYGQDSMLVRITGGTKIAWSVRVPTLTGIDACDGDAILVRDEPALIAVARATGAITGRVEHARSWWRARDGSEHIEVSTPDGSARWSRDLTQREPIASPGVAGESIDLPSLGDVLASHGDLRLVRATPRTAVLLDRTGVRAYLPLAEMGAALGERSVLAASWQGSPGESIRRFAIPDERYPRSLRIAEPPHPVMLPAELRDLPAAEEAPAAIAAPDGKGLVKAIAVADDIVYAMLESSLVRFDLHTRTWSQPKGTCSGAAIALAVAHDNVVCAARAEQVVTVEAPDHRWTVPNVDRVDASATLVVGFDADRLTVFDQHETRPLATLTSDDGAPMRAAALDVNGMALLITAERNRIVARLPYVQMTAAWSVDVRGVVAGIVAAGDGVLVTLEDGDAYRVDARTGEVTSVAGIGLSWSATDDVIAAIGPGGPVAPEGWPQTPALAPMPKGKGKAKGKAAPKGADADDDPPRLMTPIAPPANLATSWQLTLYELTGALRVRNDYALPGPITPGVTRGRGAPLVLQSGADLLVVHPSTGDPVRRVHLPEPSVPGTAFSTIVDGKPLVGALLANPLRVVLF